MFEKYFKRPLRQAGGEVKNVEMGRREVMLHVKGARKEGILSRRNSV